MAESITVPSNAKPLPQGRWLNKDELYDKIINPVDVSEDVPPGDKTNSFLVTPPRVAKKLLIFLGRARWKLRIKFYPQANVSGRKEIALNTYVHTYHETAIF